LPILAICEHYEAKFENIVEHEEHIKMSLKHDIRFAQKPFSCGGILEVVQNSF
jgi:hypothetical protein